MIALTTPAQKFIARQVLTLFRQRRNLPVKRLNLRLHLIEDLCFELLDVVDIILDLERRFHLHIPDEVAFDTIGDFVEYVAFHSRRSSRS
jgi:acyl carrier protein